MSRASLIRVGEELLPPSEVIFDIVHNGEIVATLPTQDQVWEWYFAKKYATQFGAGDWTDLMIGDTGLIMEDKASHSDYRQRTRLEWKTVPRKNKENKEHGG